MIAGVVFTAFALSVTAAAVVTHFSGDGRLGVLGHRAMIVLSGSMAPTIRTGDLVVDSRLTAAQAAALQPGQIITFRAAGGTHPIFTHRITAVETGPGGGVAYRTRGDANDSQDALATSSTNVVGLYQSRIPYGGYILNALHQPQVLGLLLALPALWLLSASLWKWAGREEAS